MSSMWMDLANVEHRIGFAQAGEIRTRYLEAGAGHKEALIFLHGSGGYFEAYARNIRSHAEHFRTFGIDMIGHGFSDKPDHPYEIHHYVDHLIAFMDALGLERAHISGESLGGWVAARFAAKHPDRVGKIVLNTAAGVHYDPVVSDRIRNLSLQAARTPSKENIQKRLEWLMLDPKQVTEEMVDMRYAVYQQPHFARAMEHIMCLHTREYRLPNLLTESELARMSAPTLVLWTSHDPGSSIEIGEKLAHMIKNARFVVMENCGHWPQFEDATNFNLIHRKFLLS